MAQVIAYNRDGSHTMKDVKVGDFVGFKSDHEQYGRIVKIVRVDGYGRDQLHLHNPDGFSGEYLRYSTDTVECAGDCWID
jgi:hypothetical protein